MRGFFSALVFLWFSFAPWVQAATGHSHHRMSLDANGATMNANDDVLPRDCSRIQAEHSFEVHAGHRYARDVPGAMFGYNIAEFHVEPCSQVSVTLVNEDEVRHQWMLHGLPRYLYPGGMFHLEVSGGHRRTASFIVPSDEKTYLVHCDMSQHMEKGMKAQLKVGRGSGDFWSVPGISGDLEAGPAARRPEWRRFALEFLAALLVSLLAWRWAGAGRRR